MSNFSFKQTDNIPKELRDIPQWVNWKRVHRDGRWTKVPTDGAGTRISITDPSNFRSFEAVIAAYEAGLSDGIGFAFTENDPFCGIDLDHCIDPEGNIHPDALGIVETLDSYTERSPSGEGLHIIVRGRMLEGWKHKNMGTYAFPVEVYDRKRFFTVTGDRVEAK